MDNEVPLPPNLVFVFSFQYLHIDVECKFAFTEKKVVKKNFVDFLVHGTSSYIYHSCTHN